MIRVVAVVSWKGGVGKSTISVHLAACAALHGQRALLVDIDPQPGAAGWLGDRLDRQRRNTAPPS
jgi:chromosome partitioning protein